jgi:GT2 family glycosyltransferase
VDWALRAAWEGWTLGLLTDVEVTHTRSASFGTSTKGAYYYWRNRWLLLQLHAAEQPWRRVWLRKWLRFVARPTHLRSGASANALLGGLHAVKGRFGPRPLRA